MLVSTGLPTAEAGNDKEPKVPPDAPVIDMPMPEPARPVPVSGGGGNEDIAENEALSAQQASTYSTTVLDEESTLAENGIAVYTSTAPGSFAITGAILNAGTAIGDPVANATVTIQPSAGGSSLQATTDVDGAFAFVDVPVVGESQLFDFTISAAGFGPYSVVNETFVADETYVISAELDSSTQSFDESQPAEDSTVGPTVTGTSGYPSHIRVPPSIMVEIWERIDDCAKGDRKITTKNYPWKFYVLHVATAEIDSRWGRKAWKANAAAIQTMVGITGQRTAPSTTRGNTSASNRTRGTRRSGRPG